MELDNGSCRRASVYVATVAIEEQENLITRNKKHNQNRRTVVLVQIPSVV